MILIREMTFDNRPIWAFFEDGTREDAKTWFGYALGIPHNELESNWKVYLRRRDNSFK